MTQVNWSRQLALAAALFVLGTAAYWLEFKHKPEKESSEEQSKKVFQLKNNPVQAVTLKDGARVFTLNCSDFAAKLCKPEDNSKWEVSEPTKLKADDANANALLSTLNTLTTTQTIDLKEETPEKRSALLKEYGLDAQSRTTDRQIILSTASGGTALYLGSAHPIGDAIYAVKEQVPSGQKPTGKVDENQVYLIPNFIKANLEHDLTYWRDKKLFTVAAHDVDSFKLDGSKAHISGDKKTGQWVLHANQEELAGDVENVDNLLTAATFLSAKNFASDSKTDLKAKAALKGLAPVLTLTLQKEKGSAKEAPSPITLTLFQKKGTDAGGKLYATLSNLDPLFELDSGTRDRLDKSLKDLRLTKLISSMDRFNTKRIEFSGTPMGKSDLILSSADGKWLIESEHQAPASPEKVNGFLDKISGNRIKDFLEGSSIPAGEKDGLKVTLSDEKGNAKRRLIFWKNDNKVYARDLMSTRKEAYLVDASLRDQLPWDRNYFKNTDTNPGAKSDNAKK